MIGTNLQLDIEDDCARLLWMQDGDEYEIEMSREAFDSLALALEHAAQQGSGYQASLAFDVDDDDEVD